MIPASAIATSGELVKETLLFELSSSESVILGWEPRSSSKQWSGFGVIVETHSKSGFGRVGGPSIIVIERR